VPHPAFHLGQQRWRWRPRRAWTSAVHQWNAQPPARSPPGYRRPGDADDGRRQLRGEAERPHGLDSAQPRPGPAVGLVLLPLTAALPTVGLWTGTLRRRLDAAPHHLARHAQQSIHRVRSGLQPLVLLAQPLQL